MKTPPGTRWPAGVSLKWILDGLKARKGQFSAKLALMGYVNPFYQYGLENLARDAAEAGVYGFIVPDMPLEESGMFRKVFAPYGLTLVTLVAPNTSVERMKEYKPCTEGFVYVVSVLGTTGREDGSGAECGGDHAPCPFRV